MQLYFIRHAQSQNNAEYSAETYPAGRQADPQLTELGVLQAQRLADYLAEHWNPAPGSGSDPLNRQGYFFTHLYTSLMVRSVHTASILGARLNLRLAAWLDLHERGGMYLDDPDTREKISQPGQPRSFFETHYPELQLPPDVDEAGWWKRPAETREEPPLRAARVLKELLARHGNENDRVAWISHGGFYNSFLSTLLRISLAPPPEELTLWPWFALHNTGITRIDFSAEHAELQYLNRVDHLPAEMLT